MTVWVMRQRLSAEEEPALTAKTDLQLPFDGLPDLTHVENQSQARQLLAALYPAEPPEALRMRLDRFWHQYAGMHIEDIIAVPMPHSQQVAIAEVTGKYHYRVGEGGSDLHLIPVRWHDRRASMRKLSKHKELFSESAPALREVSDVEARTAIRDHLPHGYNRFARWKWLMALFMLMTAIRMMSRL
jgi:predicted Mrr-cat superfamily restriction endonuclease